MPAAARPGAVSDRAERHLRMVTNPGRKHVGKKECRCHGVFIRCSLLGIEAAPSWGRRRPPCRICVRKLQGWSLAANTGHIRLFKEAGPGLSRKSDACQQVAGSKRPYSSKPDWFKSIERDAWHQERVRRGVAGWLGSPAQRIPAQLTPLSLESWTISCRHRSRPESGVALAPIVATGRLGIGQQHKQA